MNYLYEMKEKYLHVCPGCGCACLINISVSGGYHFGKESFHGSIEGARGDKVFGIGHGGNSTRRIRGNVGTGSSKLIEYGLPCSQD